MNDKLNRLKQLPLHQFLGIHEINADNGKAELTVEVNNAMVNMVNVMHGGIIYTLCDVCAYAALGSVLDEGVEAVTHNIHVSVMRSAKLGDKVTFNASVTKKGRRVCFMDVNVLISNKIIATATVTKSIL